MAADVELVEVREFLAQHSPFAELPPAVLDGLPARLTARYFRRGTEMMTLGRENHSLFVVRSGAADISDENGVLVERAGAGNAIGSTTLIGGGPSRFRVRAIEDTLALVMPATVFRELASAHEQFLFYFSAQRASRMRAAIRAPVAGGSSAMGLPAARILRRDPVTAPVTVTIAQAAEAMSKAGVSALLVMDGARLAGIVTDRDLRNRVLAAGLDPASPVAEIMTPDPVTCPADAAGFEVLLEMTARGIHHLPVVDAVGAPIGMVTSTDLIRLEQAHPVHLASEVARQPDAVRVAEAARRLPEVVERLEGQGIRPGDVGRLVTTVGDAVERRLLALAETALGPPPVPYCWVVLGSRARSEQALATDQDNALILSDDAGPEHAAYFAELARTVHEGLLAAGYPPCPGDVMAVTERWRAPVAQWRREFASWIAAPEPDAVLAGSIFLDMRPVHGDPALFAAVRGAARDRARHADRFLAYLAKHAVQEAPPLGFFRGFVLERRGEHRDTLDIKTGGLRAIVEFARVLAVAAGLDEVNTERRLRAAVRAGVLGEELAENLLGAWEVVSRIRLRHQAAQVRAGAAPDNHVRPADLSELDRRNLRDAFAVVRQAQGTLTVRYPLAFMA